MCLLSIIVPTKNRYIYLYSIINLFKSNFLNTDVELVIQDNSDDNSEIVDYLKNHKLENVKYFYCGERLAVTENFDLGIRNSKGEYVTMIGDDDTVSSLLIDVVKMMKDKGIESAIFKKGIYKWPDVLAAVNGNIWSNKIHSLKIRKGKGCGYYVNPINELHKTLSSGGVSLGKMPEVYHGIVARATLEKIYTEVQTYFPGPSPDMAIAIALSLKVKNHVYIDLPYTCSGQSFTSAGGQGMRKQHKGKLEDMSFLPKDTIDNWENSIPKVWTPQTIYAASIFRSLRLLKKEDLISSFNYEQCFSEMMLNYPEFKDVIVQTAKFSEINTNNIMKRWRVLKVRSVLAVPYRWLRQKLNLDGDVLFDGISSSMEASKLLDEFIASGPKLTINVD